MPNWDWRDFLATIASGGVVPLGTVRAWRDWLSQMEASGKVAQLSPYAIEPLIKAGIDPNESPELQRRHLQEYLKTQQQQKEAEAEAKRQQEEFTNQQATQRQEDRDYQAWLNYRGMRGALSFNDWVNQGYPPPPSAAEAAGGTQRDYAAELAEQKRQFDISEGINPYEREMLDFQQAQLQQAQNQFSQQQAYLQQQLQQQQQQFQSELQWYREQQAAELEAQKQQRLAQLKANPGSWLEYAALSGETPVIQPWMVPLKPPGGGAATPQAGGAGLTVQGGTPIASQDMPHPIEGGAPPIASQSMAQTAAPANWMAGQALPGWTPGAEGSAASLPQLLTPSAQYVARIAPSARAQYGAYEQARTGATPSDVNWLLASKVAPPGGSSGGLNWIR